MVGCAVVWQPVLHADLAVAARAAAVEIAAEIARVPEANRSPSDVALFWAYAAGAFDDAASAAALDAASAALAAHVNASRASSLGLHGGLAGAGWVLSHISDGAVDGLPALDDLLIAALDRATAQPREHDVIRGLAGYAIYFLERVAVGAPRGAVGVRRVVEQLRAAAVVDGDGLTWFTPVSPGNPSSVREAPNGRYDCGVAHGAPGVVSALARVACEGGVDPAAATEARALAIGGLAWLRARLLPEQQQGRFAPWLLPPGERTPEPAGSGWCYGEPGAPLALWTAAQRLGEPVDPWREIARASALRRDEAAAIQTPGLCHGAAGLAHQFNRCYQATREPVFADAVHYWITRTLAMRHRSTGPGGFSLMGDGTPAPASQQLLFGATGIGLALLAAAGDAEPGWDRLLACDLPARSK
jgi:hypothetical protein